MTTIEERVSRIEGGYEHLATKADLAALKGDLAALENRISKDMSALEARLTRLFLGALIAVASLAVAAATYLQSIT